MTGLIDARLSSDRKEPGTQVEWPPGIGQFQAVDLTGLWDCLSSNRLGLK